MLLRYGMGAALQVLVIVYVGQCKSSRSKPDGPVTLECFAEYHTVARCQRLAIMNCVPFEVIEVFLQLQGFCMAIAALHLRGVHMRSSFALSVPQPASWRSDMRSLEKL